MEYKTYHYGDDNINDAGWGCSYRNLQTILACYKKYYNNNIEIPNIKKILSFYNKDINDNKYFTDIWIEPYQIYEYLTNFNKEFSGYNCLYVKNKNDMSKILKTDISIYTNNNSTYTNFDDIYMLIIEHFAETKLPIVIDDGIFSYCFILLNDNEILLIDPHIQNDNNTINKPIDYLKKSFWMYFFPKIKK